MRLNDICDRWIRRLPDSILSISDFGSKESTWNLSNRTSLSTKIVFLVISISVVSIIALATISINISQQTLKKDAAQRLNVIASDRMQTMNNIWNLQMEQVDSLASDHDIPALLVLRQRSTNNLSSDQGSKEMELITKIKEDTFQRFRSLTDKDSSLAIIQLIDNEGELVTSSNGNSQSDFDNRQFALEIMKNYQEDRLVGGKLSNPFYTIAYNTHEAAAVLVIMAPVFDPDSMVEGSPGRVPLGSVVVFKEIDSANNILGDKRFMGETGESYLVDRNGLMLTNSRFDESARYQQVVSSVPVEACFKDGADVNAAQYISYRDKLVFGTSQCERNIGIALLAEQDNTELFSPIVTLQQQYLVIILGIICAAALVSFYLSLSILRPLQKLRDIMKNVQSGTFQKSDIIRSDEIGDLSTSFNSMVDELEIRAKKLKLRNDILELMSARLGAQADALAKADKEKEEFSTMISDELKRFVIPIIGYCELILDGSLGEIGKKPKEKVEIMLERAWSLQNLVQNILDVRRLDSGMLKMNIQRDVSVTWLIQQSVGRVSAIARSKGITIDVETDERMKLDCDPARTVQMLENLLEYSIRSTTEDNVSKIQLRASLSSELVDREVSVVFAVESDNARISEQQKKDILSNKFYNLDTSFTRTSGGMDLDIVIVRSIVEAHRGRISIQSDNGKSRIVVSMPLGQNTKIPAAA
jgi:signal transduction histidine kinase